MNKIEPTTGPFNATVEDNDHTSSSDHTSTAPYQVFHRLPSDKYAALREDIKQNGVLVPIEVNAEGKILDGHDRVAIAQELNKPYNKVVRNLSSEEEKIAHALKMNLLRQDIGPWSFAKAMQRLMDVRGIKRGDTHNRYTPRKETLAALAQEFGVSARTARNHFKLYETLADYPRLGRLVDAKEMSANAALKLAKSPDFATEVETGKLKVAEALKALKEEAKKQSQSNDRVEGEIVIEDAESGQRSAESSHADLNIPGSEQEDRGQPEPEAQVIHSADEGEETCEVSPCLKDRLVEAVMACLQPFPEVSLSLIEEAYQQAWRDIQTRLGQQDGSTASTTGTSDC